MAINTGNIGFNANFKVGTAAPLDSRITVEYENDLYSDDFKGQFLYNGLIIVVQYADTNKTPLGDAYILCDVTKLKNTQDTEVRKTCFKKIVSGDGLVWNDFSTTTTTEQGDETTT